MDSAQFARLVAHRDSEAALAYLYLAVAVVAGRVTVGQAEAALGLGPGDWQAQWRVAVERGVALVSNQVVPAPAGTGEGE